MCDKYQNITEEGLTIQGKLTALQDKAPKMLKRIINAGKVKKLFRKHKKHSDRYLDQVKF